MTDTRIIPPRLKPWAGGRRKVLTTTEVRVLFRVCLIGVPVVYLLGICTLATVYMTANDNMEFSSAVFYGLRWPIIAFQSLGLL